MQTTKRLLMTALFLITASFAAAQTPLTYTAQIGTVHCTNRVGQLPAVNHGCPIRGLVGATGTQTANFATQGLQDGTDFVVFGIEPAGQTVYANGTWAPLSGIPPPGTSVLFSFDATITDTCQQICSPASGTFHLEGEWAFQYKTVCWRGCVFYQEWINTTPVLVTIFDQSTVAILD